MAITRSMKKGRDPPASNDNQSSEVEDVRKNTSKPKAPRHRRVVQKNKVDHLTALPLELFRMIMEELVGGIAGAESGRGPTSYSDYRKHINHMINMRSVCKLFKAETVNAIFKAGRPLDASTKRFWGHLTSEQPLLVIRLLREESLARPTSDIGLVNLLQQVVEKLHSLREDTGSTDNRPVYLETALTCLLHASGPETISWYIGEDTRHIYSSDRRFKMDVIDCCWSIASWMGDISLLEALVTKFGPIDARRDDYRKPSSSKFMGSALWAAARNGQAEAMHHLLRMGCRFKAQGDFGGFGYVRTLALCGAIYGNHANIFKEILPAYDDHRVGDGCWDSQIIESISRMIMMRGSEQIARAFWTRKPPLSENHLSEALTDVCLMNRSDQMKKAAILIEAGASVNDYCGRHKRTPLEAVIAAGTPEILQFLLENGGNPNAAFVKQHGKRKKHHTDPLVRALNLGKVGAMKILLQHCKWETATKFNLLFEAVVQNKLEMVKIIADHLDSTASKRAAHMGRAAVRQARADLKTEIIDELLARGCEE